MRELWKALQYVAKKVIIILIHSIPFAIEALADLFHFS